MPQASHETLGNWVATADEYYGYRAGRLLHRAHRTAISQNQVRRTRKQLRGGGAFPILIAHSPVEIDRKIAVDRPAKLLKLLPEHHGAALTSRIVLGVQHQRADAPHSIGLLRPRRERPRGHRTADVRDELSPPHELPSNEAQKLSHLWTISAPVHRSEIFPLMSVQGQRPPRPRAPEDLQSVSAVPQLPAMPRIDSHNAG